MSGSYIPPNGWSSELRYRHCTSRSSHIKYLGAGKRPALSPQLKKRAPQDLNPVFTMSKYYIPSWSCCNLNINPLTRLPTLLVDFPVSRYRYRSYRNDQIWNH